MAYNALQIQVANALIHNQGIKTLPAALTTAIAAYNATTVITNWLAAVSWYQTQAFYTDTTFQSLLSIGDSVCPALGNSVPVAPVGTYTALRDLYLALNPDNDFDPDGLANFVESLGDAYLGVGNGAAFAQGFNAVAGFIATSNQFITAAAQANEYLGPTFTNLNNLYTSGVSQATTDIENFAWDLKNTGNLFLFDQLPYLGEPATLLQSLAAGANGGILPDVYEQLLLQGLLPQDITDLVTNNRQGLFNQNGLTTNQFDQLQKRAYPALANITAQRGLQDALTILNVTTPNITALSDLLDPIKVFPNSWPSLLTPTVDGPINIYQPNGALSPGLEQAISNFAAAPVGCDELGKIIPPETAVATKALQSGLAQINNIVNIAPQAMSQALRDFGNNAWNPALPYLANDLVSIGTSNYRAQQDVPPGTDITDTAYWQTAPVDGVGLPTADLSLLNNQSTPVASATQSEIAADIATGSGPNGTITFDDVLGIATDHCDLATRFNTVTAIINSLQTAGALAGLNIALTSIVTRVNDAQVISDIATANSAIATVASGYPVDVATLNTAWTYISNCVNQELEYQNLVPLNYLDVTSSSVAGNSDVYSFAQNISNFGKDCVSGGSWDFLKQVADNTTLGGQSLTAGLQVAANQERLGNAGIGILPFPIPENLPITPPCAVTPQ
jgi:hypothetical protein